MPRVAFTVSLEMPNPREVDPGLPAVPAAPYVHLDDEAGNPGGVTRADLAGASPQPIGSFQVGVEVFVQSEDVLDDADPETTRIWWRGTIIESAG